MKTAKEIREQCEKDIEELQKVCPHEKSEWMGLEYAPAHTYGSGRVCLCCNKILERG